MTAAERTDLLRQVRQRLSTRTEQPWITPSEAIMLADECERLAAANVALAAAFGDSKCDCYLPEVVAAFVAGDPVALNAVRLAQRALGAVHTVLVGAGVRGDVYAAMGGTATRDALAALRAVRL